MCVPDFLGYNDEAIAEIPEDDGLVPLSRTENLQSTRGKFTLISSTLILNIISCFLQANTM